MDGQSLRQALRQGRHVFGIALEGYAQPMWPARFARLGLDMVFIDGEHTPLNLETVVLAVQAYAAHGVAPLFRIPEASAMWANKGLDLGAHGLIVPYVETVAQVREMVGVIRYRPLKGAALTAALDDGRFPSAETGPYLQRFNANAALVIMIESPTGVANLADMLAGGGVDAVLIGPHDLSVATGVPEQYDHPAFLAQVQATIDTCRAHAVGVGVHCGVPDPDLALSWIRMGCNMTMYSSDTMFIQDGVTRGLAAIRVACNEKKR